MAFPVTVVIRASLVIQGQVATAAFLLRVLEHLATADFLGLVVTQAIPGSPGIQVSAVSPATVAILEFQVTQVTRGSQDTVA